MLVIKIPPAAKVARGIAMIAQVTDHGCGHFDPECAEILEYDRIRIADWLDEQGFPGAAAVLKKELSKLEKENKK